MAEPILRAECDRQALLVVFCDGSGDCQHNDRFNVGKSSRGEAPLDFPGDCNAML
jgi:hypothetical protein